MGCFVGLVAGVVALVGGYFVAEWTAAWFGPPSLFVGVGFAALVLLVGWVMVYTGGHRAFGSGQNTDMPLFVVAVGIVFAVIIPRFNEAAACRTRDAVGQAVVWAQEAFHADSGRYLGDAEGLRAALDLRESVDEMTTLTIEEATDSSFATSVAFSLCDDGEPIWVSLPSPPEESTP